MNHNTDSPEELLDVFRAAALSVTKLYKTSAQAQAKARTDGYQDCLEDLLSFLDKEGLCLGDGDGRKIRRWAQERLDGRENIHPTVESGEEDEADKPENMSSPELHRTASPPQLQGASSQGSDTPMRTESSSPPTAAAQPLAAAETTAEEPEATVPTQDTFTFRSQISYPQETYLDLANLDLSDSRSGENTPPPPSHTSAPPSITISRRNGRYSAGGQRLGGQSVNHLGRGAGQKRKLNHLNLREIFDLSSLPSGKDVFGNRSSKRNRQT